MARRTLSILAVIGATGCGDPVAPTTAELLEGSWTWVDSSGGITGGTFTIEYAQSLFGFTSQGLSVGEEELILRDGCCDGFVYRFQRMAAEDGG